MSRFFSYLFALMVIFSFTACSSSDTTTEESTGVSKVSIADSAYAGSYKIDYTSITSPASGKTVFTLTITDKDSGAVLPGLAVTLTPLMKMVSGDEHGAVVDSVTDNGDGSYGCVVYYLMASSMGDIKMGDWELRLDINGQEAIFSVDVMMAMGDTSLVQMSNTADMIMSMSGARSAMESSGETRKYFLFKDDLMGATGDHMFKLKIVTRQSMMSHPPGFAGAVLQDHMGVDWTVATMSVLASTDTQVWVEMTDNGAGHWSVAGLEGLVDGMEGAIYVKMNINGQDYTTDGLPVAGGNAYQTFSVTPGANMSM